MEQDFNPFDLSRIPPKPSEDAQPLEPQKPEATVSRISMGPLFHSRITKALAVGLGLILSVLIGYSATAYLLNRQTDAKATSQTKTTDTKTDATNATIDAKALDDAQRQSLLWREYSVPLAPGSG